jgi:hypothetical protein
VRALGLQEIAHALTDLRHGLFGLVRENQRVSP